jgi:hypothetical protein
MNGLAYFGVIFCAVFIFAIFYFETCALDKSKFVRADSPRLLTPSLFFGAARMQRLPTNNQSPITNHKPSLQVQRSNPVFVQTTSQRKNGLPRRFAPRNDTPVAWQPTRFYKVV